jgi:hypothetical protein
MRVFRHIDGLPFLREHRFNGGSFKDFPARGIHRVMKLGFND